MSGLALRWDMGNSIQRNFATIGAIARLIERNRAWDSCSPEAGERLMEISNRLRNFIVTEMEWKGSPEQLTQDYNLIENGVVDSLGLFMLVAFIEDQFGCQFSLEDLIPANFETIDVMVRLIQRKGATSTDQAEHSRDGLNGRGASPPGGP